MMLLLLLAFLIALTILVVILWMSRSKITLTYELAKTDAKISRHKDTIKLAADRLARQKEQIARGCSARTTDAALRTSLLKAATADRARDLDGLTQRFLGFERTADDFSRAVRALPLLSVSTVSTVGDAASSLHRGLRDLNIQLDDYGRFVHIAAAH